MPGGMVFYSAGPMHRGGFKGRGGGMMMARSSAASSASYGH